MSNISSESADSSPGTGLQSAPRRRLGHSGLQVSPVALGCWPIAGITTLGTTDQANRETIAACLDVGINFLDTAYTYGYDGESERAIAAAVGHRRDELVIASKGGIEYVAPKQTAQDASPARLHQQCDESLTRLGTDRIDLYYLHAPDPRVPIEESAGAIAELVASGKVRFAGVSNVDLSQLERFHATCPVTALQPPYNMLQRGIERELVPWCQTHDVATCIFWPLMKGLLAGKIRRDFVFHADDGRQKYPMFQGEEFDKNMAFVDRLEEIASGIGCTIAQLVVAWTIHQPGITVALCGAKRPEQIRETAAAMHLVLDDQTLTSIRQAIDERGEAVTRRAV